MKTIFFAKFLQILLKNRGFNLIFCCVAKASQPLRGWLAFTVILKILFDFTVLKCYNIPNNNAR
jgi:hypothetical protein